eukprot:scaffold53580_cov65-Phaeocystis_antarctica.AAC.13
MKAATGLDPGESALQRLTGTTAMTRSTRRWPVSGSASLATDATLATATTTEYRVPLLARLKTCRACHCFSLAGGSTTDQLGCGGR